MKTTRIMVLVFCLALLLGVSASTTAAECSNCPGDPITAPEPGHEHGFLCIAYCQYVPSHCFPSS